MQAPGFSPPSGARHDVAPVYATHEGWQAPAPHRVPPSAMVPSGAVLAAERERRILLWAAVLGIAILIGVLLAVAV